MNGTEITEKLNKAIEELHEVLDDSDDAAFMNLLYPIILRLRWLRDMHESLTE